MRMQKICRAADVPFQSRMNRRSDRRAKSLQSIVIMTRSPFFLCQEIDDRGQATGRTQEQRQIKKGRVEQGVT